MCIKWLRSETCIIISCSPAKFTDHQSGRTSHRLVAMALKVVSTMALMISLCMLFMVGSTWGRESVTINNRLPVELWVFCHSYEDKLAVQRLAPSAVYIFHFRANLFGDTLFTCDFAATGYGYQGIKVWEGFNYAHRACRCTQCKWDVTMGGFGCNGKYITGWGV